MKRAHIFCLLMLGLSCQKQPAVDGSRPQPPTAQDAYRQPERLVAALALSPGSSVADIGAGGGYLTLPLARAVGTGGRVVATDTDAEALAALRERARELPQVTTRLVSADAPGLEPATFDLILLSQVDHLLPDRASYLRALGPGLRSGGRIALCNSQRHFAAAQAAAVAAGFRVERVKVDLPAQFLLLLHRD
jgi:ubiquinone/menaquinone biosynthesis C-methylase UbiE